MIFIAFVGIDYRIIKGFNYTDPRTPDAFNVRGTAHTQFDENINFISNATLNYIKEIGKNRFGGFVGVEYRSDTREGFTSQAENFPTTEFRYPSSAANPIAIGGFRSGSRKNAVFGNLLYEYGVKYLISAIGRYDGSSRFGKNKRCAFFPSISCSRIISEESFLKRNKILNIAKLRASYGSTGDCFFHPAGANNTDQIRKVMTMIYMDRYMILKGSEN